MHEDLSYECLREARMTKSVTAQINFVSPQPAPNVAQTGTQSGASGF